MEVWRYGQYQKKTKLIRFVKRALNIIKKAHIPLRSSKFSILCLETCFTAHFF